MDMIIKLWRTQRGPERTLNLINNSSTETKKKQKESSFLRTERLWRKALRMWAQTFWIHWWHSIRVNSWPGFCKALKGIPKMVSISKLATFSVSSFEGKNTLALADVKATFPWDWDLESWYFRVRNGPSWDLASSRNTARVGRLSRRPCFSPHHSTGCDYQDPQLCQEQIFFFFSLLSLAWSPVSHKCNSV